jgi:hypothetical protein
MTMDDLIFALAAIDPPNEPGFTRVLGVPLQFEKERPSFVVYRASLPDGPFESAEIRINKEDPTGIVVLTPRAGQEPAQEDMDPSAYGDLQNVDVQPRVPPEGAVTHVYKLGKPTLNMSFTASSRVLRSVSLVWDTEAA